MKTTQIRTAAWLLAVVAAGWLAVPACSGQVREPHVAGQFYPADREELTRQIEGFLDATNVPIGGSKPRVLILPHAGYRYSGPVAAAGFRRLQGHAYDGVVVVGFTHRYTFDGVSVDTVSQYVTPLGAIPVDQQAVAQLQELARAAAGDEQPALRHHEEAHLASEHSLEVMLPFLQVVLGEFRLVPVLMGRVPYERIASFAEALAALARQGDYLFVFSTDLSHYHDYETAKQRDAVTVEAMLHETPQAVHRLFTHQQLEACGRAPILAAVALGDRLGYLKRELLRYANSGDTAGDRASVVGYAAIGMFDRAEISAGRLSDEAGMALVRAARNTLERALRHGEAPQPISIEAYPELAQTSGVFVTLHRDGLLCGCIGRVETNEPLATSVPIVALDAALRDARFDAVRPEELSRIHVEVSVLTKPRQLERVDELVPGRDGVVLEHRGRRGVFLPSVWKTSGWTREEFLRQLASQKAGLPPEAWREATLYSFQDQVFEEPRGGPSVH